MPSREMNMTAKNSIYANAELGRLIVEASPCGMIIADAEGRIVLANPQALEWFGYSESELVGSRIEILIPDAHRGQHAEYRSRYASRPVPRPMAAGRDLFGRRRDGSEFPVDISLHPIETESGKLVLANIVDATLRQQSEKERETRQAMEKLALLGQLAGGVAHEIRTPLCVISNDVYFLQSIVNELGPDAQECINEIKSSVAKANRIVSELLDFTREPTSSLAQADLEEIIQSAIHMASIPREVNLRRQGVNSLFQVDVDRDQIERILINLLRNAVQAMRGEGELVVELELDAQCVKLRIGDNGPGIPKENRNRIFEPLFTTKAKGIGLGLAISRRYAERNGGELKLYNSTSSGTTFQLSLPVYQPARENA